MSATYCSAKSRAMILDTLKWSFNCLRNLALKGLYKRPLFQGSGIYPAHDPWGKAFSKSYHRKRWELRGKRIAGPYVGCLDAILGDQDYIKTILSPTRFLDRNRGQ